jgi:carbonic anhydrase
MPTPSETGPAASLARLRAGNERFVSGAVERPHQSAARRAEVARGQAPFAVVVGCSDSRVPPELIFDCGLGDLFVVRTAGHVIDDAVQGSIDYAVLHLHAPFVLVLGHSGCGAVKATVQTLNSGGTPADDGIGALMRYIAPAFEEVRNQPGDLTANTEAAHVRLTVPRLAASQPVMAEAVAAGRVQVAGAVYVVESGVVSFL